MRHACVHVCVFVYMCVYVCVCVDRARQKQQEPASVSRATSPDTVYREGLCCGGRTPPGDARCPQRPWSITTASLADAPSCSSCHGRTPRLHCCREHRVPGQQQQRHPASPRLPLHSGQCGLVGRTCTAAALQLRRFPSGQPAARWRSKQGNQLLASHCHLA